jgi:hypothetical protein
MKKTGRCVSRCKRGTHLEGEVCISDKKKKLETNTLPRVCPPDRPVGAYPNCCPQGTDFRNGKCRFTKAAPVKCRKSQMFDPATGICVDRTRRQRFCPADRPVGAYPDCCPEGYQFANGKCRRLREQRQEQQYCPAIAPSGSIRIAVLRDISSPVADAVWCANGRKSKPVPPAARSASIRIAARRDTNSPAQMPQAPRPGSAAATGAGQQAQPENLSGWHGRIRQIQPMPE